MITARVTSKGQVTIPKEIREKLGIRVGEEVGFEEENGRLVIKKAFTRSPFDKWKGKLAHLEGRSGDELVKEIRGHDNGC